MENNTYEEKLPEPARDSVLRQGTMVNRSSKAGKAPAIPKAKVGFLGGLFTRKKKNSNASEHIHVPLKIETVDDVESPGTNSTSRSRELE